MPTHSDTFRYPGRPPAVPAQVAGMAAVAALYFLTGKAGLLLASYGDNVTLVWPPTGLATAVLFRAGYRYAAGVFVGALAVNLTLSDPLVAAGIACGNTAAPAVAAVLLRRLRFLPGFGTWRDVAVLFGVAVSAMTASAANGTGWLVLADGQSRDRADDIFLTWWLGDAAGVMVVAPLLLAWRWDTRGRLADRRHRRAVLLATGQCVTLCVALFTDLLPAGKWVLPAVFLPFVCAARTATVLGAWPAAVQILIASGFAAWANYAGTGPPRYIPPDIRPYLLWGYLTALSGLTLAVAGLLAEKERAARKLAASEAEYRNMVDDNPAVICRFRASGVLVYANATYRRLLGDAAAAPGTRFFAASGLAADPQALAELADLRLTDPPLTLDALARGADGTDHWVRWTVRAVDLASAAACEFHAVGLDVTGQKRAEAARRELEGHAVQVQKLESIGVLAGGLAHEFNNILTGVLGNAELAQMTLPAGDPAQEFLADVRSGANRAAALTRQLLVYAGRADLRAGPTDASELVRAAAELLSVAVPRRCELRYDLGEGLPLVHADEAKLRQVLVNLVTNAGEALPPGQTGCVTVRTGTRRLDPADAVGWVGRPDLPAGEYVLIEVADTGPGMPPDVLARAFEPFFTTRFPGRGLGLPAVLGIARDHGGAVRVASRAGRGTTVSILLPPLPLDADTDSGENTPVPIDSFSPLPALRGERPA